MMFGKSKKTPCPEENRMCAYCEQATVLGDSGTCICAHKGVVKDDGFCRKFSFDLLKLKPHTLKLTDTEENSLLFTE